MELWDVIIEGAKAIVALAMVVGTIHVLASVYAAINMAANGGAANGGAANGGAANGGAANDGAANDGAASKDELPS